MKGSPEHMTEALGCAGVPGWSGEIGAAGGGAPDKEAWFGLFQPPPFGLLMPVMMSAQRTMAALIYTVV